MSVLCSQGEQCNIVPDNVDDIVADIAQEEKEEGLHPVPFSLFHTRLKAHLTMVGYYRTPIPLSILQMILLRHVSTQTGLHGLPAARPLVKRANE